MATLALPKAHPANNPTALPKIDCRMTKTAIDTHNVKQSAWRKGYQR